ncbi:hypothetical protein [Pseudaquabacterium rugosum]|uniref:Uncharacterized protein n=1 Tax=Pseudaquabacterium rugosum TaxID=2984194 RepID=A0ABU9BFW6_9BURK
MNDPISCIQACEFLYLHSISEPEEGGVRLVIHEARTGEQVNAEVLDSEPLAEVKKILAQSSAIVHSPGCKVFTLTWAKYIGYCVENESFALPEPDSSEYEGRLLRVYTKSVYLNYLARSSFATPDYPGPFRHYCVLCLDHIVNVASTQAPTILVSDDA